MRNAGLEEAEAGIKIARRNINNLRYADDTTRMAESKEASSTGVQPQQDPGVPSGETAWVRERLRERE